MVKDWFELYSTVDILYDKCNNSVYTAYRHYSNRSAYIVDTCEIVLEIKTRLLNQTINKRIKSTNYMIIYSTK